MERKQKTIPDHTAVRTALWRAMHVLVDHPPHVFHDDLGLKLASPDANWQQRSDMHPQGTAGYRASIVGRARFVEDLLEEKMKTGTNQYVILGAGLDTFSQRRPELLSKLKVFEIDEPPTQAWKRQRLVELDLSLPANLKFVPVDFEAGDSWLEKLHACGFDKSRPALIASTGVAMYLTREANMDTMKKIASLAPGSTFAMTFMLPPNLVDVKERPQYEMVMERAAAAGTPFIGLYTSEEVLKMALEAGFKNVKHISRSDIINRYFNNRPDGLKPASGEEFLVATT